MSLLYHVLQVSVNYVLITQVIICVMIVHSTMYIPALYGAPVNYLGYSLYVVNACIWQQF